MHDGQTLFDAATSLVGEWQVDETLEALSQQGIEAIAVGIPNMPDRRLDEYSPYRNDLLGMGGQGDAYLAFIIETVKPLINRDFRTQTDRAHTGIMGSSMGGLISLVAYCRYADVFGFAGIMSPAFWFAKDAIFAEVAATLPPPGRLYLDVGTREIADPTDRDHRIGAISERYLGDAQAMRDLLVEKGYHAGRDVVYVEEQDAPHHEIAWARRLPDALRFLLAGRT
jgi:predicted alpha/beta superfamily hydrolase